MAKKKIKPITIEQFQDKLNRDADSLVDSLIEEVNDQISSSRHISIEVELGRIIVDKYTSKFNRTLPAGTKNYLLDKVVAIYTNAGWETASCTGDTKDWYTFKLPEKK